MKVTETERLGLCVWTRSSMGRIIFTSRTLYLNTDFQKKIHRPQSIAEYWIFWRRTNVNRDSSYLAVFCCITTEILTIYKPCFIKVQAFRKTDKGRWQKGTATLQIQHLKVGVRKKRRDKECLESANLQTLTDVHKAPAMSWNLNLEHEVPYSIFMQNWIPLKA